MQIDIKCSLKKWSGFLNMIIISGNSGAESNHYWSHSWGWHGRTAVNSSENELFSKAWPTADAPWDPSITLYSCAWLLNLASVLNLYLPNVALCVLCLYRFTNSSDRLGSNSGLNSLVPTLQMLFSLHALPVSPSNALPVTFMFSSLNFIFFLI